MEGLGNFPHGVDYGSYGVGRGEKITLLCLLYLSVDIAGSGDPLYVAELYKCWFYGQTSSIRLILFAKVVYYMREEGQDQLKGAKSMELLPKK